MIATAPAELEARCPGCGEDRLIEYDRALHRWLCQVCSRQWKVTNPEREI